MEVAGSRFPHGNIRVEEDVAAVAGSVIDADPLQLREVMNNLLNDACDAVAGKKGNVSVRGRHSEGPVTIRIDDNGLEIAVQDVEKVFDPFFTTKAKGPAWD